MIASAAVTAPKAAHSNAIEQDQKTPLSFFSAIKSLARSLDETTLLAKLYIHTHKTQIPQHPNRSRDKTGDKTQTAAPPTLLTTRYPFQERQTLENPNVSATTLLHSPSFCSRLLLFLTIARR